MLNYDVFSNQQTDPTYDVKKLMLSASNVINVSTKQISYYQLKS